MAKPKLTAELIKAISENVKEGLTDREACFVNNISRETFYKYLKTAENCKEKSRSKLSEHQRNCLDFLDTIKKAKILRKRLRISKLQEMPSPTGLIFLLKNEYPAEFNKQPVLIPNFQKLEEYMESEYTQSELEKIRTAILEAEARRQSEIEYDEDDGFTGDNPVDIKKVETE